MADLNYRPAETIFLKKGKEMGCRCLNGLDMLYGQADAAWEIWKKATKTFEIHI